MLAEDPPLALSSAAVIGGGPAGLMAAEVIRAAGLRVAVYEAKPSVGRKFLVAGKGGLNLTHSEPYPRFLSRYGDGEARLKPFLDAFGPLDLRAWARGLGIETFVGSSGRVFPRGMGSAPLLLAWVRRLKQQGVSFHTRHRWLGWDEEGRLRFEAPKGELIIDAAATVLALGGASWPQLGSTGDWAALLEDRGIPVAAFKAANCGFNVRWSEHMRLRFAGRPLRPVVLDFSTPGGGQFHRRGEFVVSEYGVEGSLIYAASALIREAIERDGTALVHLDLAPDRSAGDLEEGLSAPRGKRTLASVLRRRANIRGVQAALLHECGTPEELADPARLAALIKRLPLRLESPRPLQEAISSAGGVEFSGLDEHLMLRALPGVFCAGEMLDWEAPTGGYLLTACFATGRAAGMGVLSWLRTRRAASSSPSETPGEKI